MKYPSLFKPLALTVTVSLFSGCAALNDSVEKAAGLTGMTDPAPETTNEAVDVAGALANLRSVGFTESDFGSPAAMRSAATMLAALGSEWVQFNGWTAEILESNERYRERIRKRDKQRLKKWLIGTSASPGVLHLNDFSDAEERLVREKMAPVSCFTESGEVRDYSDYADAEVIRDLAFANSPHLAFESWKRAELESGNRMTWEEYVDARIEKEMSRSRESWRWENAEQFLKTSHYYQGALRSWAENCSIGTPVKYVHYVLNTHFLDVRNSLYAAAIDRVGANAAYRMAQQAMKTQVGALNSIAQALWEASDTGQWETPKQPLPAFVGRSQGVLVKHLGGMCSYFGASDSPEPDSDIIDALAMALGAEQRSIDRGFHCLSWGDGNWEKIASMVSEESRLIRDYMRQYSPVKNGYLVPSWAYPGPEHRDEIRWVRARDYRRDSGLSNMPVHERETCTTYAAKNSNLMSWTYPACDTLEALNAAFDERESLMVPAGRLDAFICVNRQGISSEPDLTACPTLYSRDSLASGHHKN